MLKGFKKFISQGNVIDLAVAVIIGNAFKPIVDKVTETIMGIIGQVIGSPNFDSVGKEGYSVGVCVHFRESIL